MIAYIIRMRCTLHVLLLVSLAWTGCETTARNESPDRDSPEGRLARVFEPIVPPANITHPGTKVSLDELVAPLLPTDMENKWLRIPWRTDVLVARREAAQQGKPIFMWMMDGDPLGCT